MRGPGLIRGLVVGVATAAAIAGTAHWQQQRDARAGAEPVPVATLHGITATPGEAGWAPMEHHQMDGADNGGFRMPAQMMPGAPEDDMTRLGIPITLVNDGDDTRWFSPAEEFTLAGGAGDAPVTLHSDTIGELPRLAPHSAVRGVLYFDIEPPAEDDPPLYLRWDRDGAGKELTVTLPGEAPPPGHGH
ncbi:hypothetical protein MTQ13_22185 [Streptomyces sp. XM4011]|uniref:hypothetical protein n=1 Tax=Streptomyces TaxID=1883 RepID=UPI001FF8AA85|nr:hypothetical protein [Streptomyces sp. XM4011]MCK1816954.1 hypothetical protein [Streptomyces sp. XM4011]